MRTTFSPDPTQMTNWPELWQAAYRILEESILPHPLGTWIQPLQFVDSEVGDGGIKVRMAAANDFSAQWVRDHYRKTIESALSQVSGKSCELVLTVNEDASDLNSTPYEPPVEPARSSRGQSVSQAVQAANDAKNRQERAQNVGGDRIEVPRIEVSSAPRFESSLDPRYHFDNYVVGASNQFAHASAVAVAEHPAKQYNPLFLYSPPGLGKTHLLHAIGSHLVAKRPGARVAYLSAEKFVNELIDSLQHRRMSQFRTKYRDSFDMILIDDIQFIAGKSTSEEEFFHTFNALHSSKRQIVVSSDRPPKEIEDLEERVRTRFEWGLVADITPPEIETRIAILKAKAERDDTYLPDDVATFLASHIETNVRALEGMLIKLQAQASLTGAEISLGMAKQELRNAVPEEGAQFTVESIQTAVAKHFHLKPQDLKSTTRARNVALPRQIAMYLIRKYTGLGFKEVGQYFGGRDHATVLHACKKIELEFETSMSLREDVEAIQNLL